MSNISVNVTSAGAANVAVSNGSTVNATVGNGGAVNVSLGTISPGNATVVSGTLAINSVTTLAAGSQAYVKNDLGTAFAAKLDIGIPAGPATSVTVGKTTTLAAGSSATVTGSTDAGNLTLSFGIPAGATGSSGTNGTTPTITASATTLSAGSSATVTATPSNGGANVAIEFGIPRGADGAAGSSGGASLSDATPAALGTASAGTSTTASRSDHVHAVPVISYANLTNVPSTFAPSSHTHTLASLTQSSATTGQVPTWNGTTWAAATPAGGDVDGGDYVGTISGGGGGGGGGSSTTDPSWSSVRLLINADLATYGYDSSSNNWSVSSVGNAIATTTNPKFGAKSLAFDGNGDYMKVVTGSSSFAFGTGDFTAEAWIYFPSLPGTGSNNQYFSLFDTRSGSASAYGYAVFVNASGQLGANWGDTQNGATLLGGSLDAATWHHVALVRSAGTMRLYANGICVASGSTNVGVNLSHNEVWISRSFTDGGGSYETNGLMGYWNGNIDDIRLTAAARYTGTSSTSTNYTVPTAAFPTS